MKKLLSIIILLTLLFTSCSDYRLDDRFEKFATNNSVLGAELPSGTYGISLSLERDKNKYHVVADFFPYAHEGDIYTWYALPLDEIKVDMKFVADKVVDFGVSEGWSGRYYLHVASQGVGTSYVYDYETDKLHYNKNRDNYIDMYEIFDTMYYKDMIDTEQGKRFLIDRGMAEERHKVVEITRLDIGPNVYINDGKFSDYGLKDSKIY